MGQSQLTFPTFHTAHTQHVAHAMLSSVRRDVSVCCLRWATLLYTVSCTPRILRVVIHRDEHICAKEHVEDIFELLICFAAQAGARPARRCAAAARGSRRIAVVRIVYGVVGLEASGVGWHHCLNSVTTSSPSIYVVGRSLGNILSRRLSNQTTTAMSSGEMVTHLLSPGGTRTLPTPRLLTRRVCPDVSHTYATAHVVSVALKIVVVLRLLRTSATWRAALEQQNVQHFIIGDAWRGPTLHCLCRRRRLHTPHRALHLAGA